jgi:TRAP-type mannitol/chloroaromatic compound transport system substrate-binding protein
MNLSKYARLAATTGLAAGLALSLGTAAEAQKRVKWKMQSAFGSKLSIVGEVAARYEGLMDRVSGGNFKIKFFEPGALVPALEAWSAVKAGSIESSWTTAGYHAGKFPALSWYTAVPFGPEMGEYMAWLTYGGGDEIYNRLYAEQGVRGLHCAAIAPETSGWFREPIDSLDQLKGMKIRFFGLGAKVMTKMGASTQLLAGADIYPALERGVIDATEFSMPSIDLDLGFYQIAKYNYFPGWHQQASIGELLINKDKYDGLSDQQRAWLDVGCSDSMMWSYVKSEAIQFKAMQELEKKGVIFKRWPDEVLDTLKAKWDEVVAEESAKDPLFAEVHKSYKSFRDQYKVWLDNGYLRK